MSDILKLNTLVIFFAVLQAKIYPTNCSPSLLKEIFEAILENSIDKVENLLQNQTPMKRNMVFLSTLHGHSPLSFAIKHNMIEMSFCLLEYSLRIGRSRLCKFWNRSRHPLRTALIAKNIELARMIAQNMDNINDYNDGVYSPLILAILTGDIEYVKIMIRLGADVNRSCSNDNSPLMSSILSDDICRFLIYQGAFLNHKDKDGFTALHLATTLKKTNILKILINAGADLLIRSIEGLTPIMFAATLINVPAVTLFSDQNAYSNLEKIEAAEVLNACLVCCQKALIDLWIHALEMRKGRYQKTVFPTNETLDFSQEFVTESEIINLQNDPLKLAFQGILVIERILGRNNSIYLRVLIQTTLIAQEGQNREKVCQLIDYIEKYCFLASSTLIVKCATYFQTLFTAIIEDPDLDNNYQLCVFSLFKMIVNVARDMWVKVQDEYSKDHRAENNNFTEVINTFLYMTSMVKQINLSQQNMDCCFNVIAQLIQTGPRVINHQSILHRAMKWGQVNSEFLVDLVQTLLACGANVYSKDFFNRTPLMYALKYVPDDLLKRIVDILFQYGSVLYHKDIEGLTASDYPRWKIL